VYIFTVTCQILDYVFGFIKIELRGFLLLNKTVRLVLWPVKMPQFSVIPVAKFSMYQCLTEQKK